VRPPAAGARTGTCLRGPECGSEVDGVRQMCGEEPGRRLRIARERRFRDRPMFRVDVARERARR